MCSESLKFRHFTVNTGLSFVSCLSAPVDLFICVSFLEGKWCTFYIYQLCTFCCCCCVLLSIGGLFLFLLMKPRVQSNKENDFTLKSWGSAPEGGSKIHGNVNRGSVCTVVFIAQTVSNHMWVYVNYSDLLIFFKKILFVSTWSGSSWRGPAY